MLCSYFLPLCLCSVCLNVSNTSYIFCWNWAALAWSLWDLIWESNDCISPSVHSLSFFVFSIMSTSSSKEHLLRICSHFFVKSGSSVPKDGLLLKQRPRGMRICCLYSDSVIACHNNLVSCSFIIKSLDMDCSDVPVVSVVIKLSKLVLGRGMSFNR